MKTLRYRFEQAVQEVNEETTEWLIAEFKSILESDKDYTRKCDYIGFSIANIDAKVASIDDELKELQALKKKLKLAKDIALRIGAEVFAEYGIDKLEGAGISSITVTKESTKSKQSIEIIDEEALIDLGYYNMIVDTDAIAKAFDTNDAEEIAPYIRLNTTDTTTTAKLKINKRRSSNSADFVNTTDTQEIA